MLTGEDESLAVLGSASWRFQMWHQIIDQETAQSIAFVREKDILADAPGNPIIGTYDGGRIYDLDGNLVGYLQNAHIPELSGSVSATFRELLAQIKQ